MHWGWIFAQIIGDGRSTKVAKMMVIHRCLTFFTVRSSLLPYVFVWEKCWEFQTTSPLGQCCSNFIWSLLGAAEWKIAKTVAVVWPKWPPCPYMLKTFKNHPLQKQISPWGLIFAQITLLSCTLCSANAEVGLGLVSLHIMYVLTLSILDNNFSRYILFLAHLSSAQDELLWSLFVRPLTFSNDFFSEAAEPILLKFHMEPP